MTKPDLPILAFSTLQAWEDWLAGQPDDAPGLWLKLAKQGCAEASLTKAEAIEGALCHGWIDGQLAAFDADWFLTRFTPRKASSAWSALNQAKAATLVEQGRVAPRGLAEIARAKADGRWAAAYPSQGRAVVPADLQAALDAAPEARRLFDERDGANRYAILYRVHQAKTPQTRATRIGDFVSMLARGDTIYPRKSKS
jgi:uncharacterized protein YdeI (YjbR/CyaY-like superfamily)